jgi:hypothetical protein
MVAIKDGGGGIGVDCFAQTLLSMEMKLGSCAEAFFDITCFLVHGPILGNISDCELSKLNYASFT